MKRVALACLVLLSCSLAAWGAEPSALIKTIQAVDRKGQGAVAAGRAVAQLARGEAKTIPGILTAFSGSNPLAVNYLRSAVETITDRTLKAGQPLPAKSLEAFIKERGNDPRARRLAYDLLVQVDKKATARLIPGMLLDPSPEFRRDAVARLVTLAGELQQAQQQDLAITLYRRALAGATDDDQVKAITGPLRKLGKTVDLPQHFGFLTRWQLVGPFDNRDRKGFAVAYAPEKKISFDVPLRGQLGETRWQKLSTAHDYGILDIAKTLKPYKGAVMYATTTFVSNSARSAELRLGTPNAWKLWVNGQLQFSREEYHRGMKLDQYRVPCVLKPGANTILLKICQNEQTEDWAQRYQFQLRVCNASGIAIAGPAGPEKSSQGNQK